MTKIKTSVLLESIGALKELSNLDLPIKLSFKIHRILKRCQTEIDSVMELKEKILDKHTQKDDKGKPIHPEDKDGKPIPNQVKLVDPDTYKKDMEEFGDQEVGMKLDELKVEDFGDKVTIKPGVLLALHWLFLSEE